MSKSTSSGVPPVVAPSSPTEIDRELPREVIFDLLSNERRQYVLRYLEQQPPDEEVTLRELVDQVAAWENDTTVDQVDSDARKRVYTALRQSHLPKLDDAGVVEYDTQRGEIEPTETASEVQLYLEYVPSGEISWSQYYLGLSAVCAALAAAAWIGIWPFAGLSGVTLAGLFAGLFAVSSVVHACHARGARLDGGAADES